MDCNNLVIVSDTHGGCRLGLCPPSPQQLTDGGCYRPSSFQRKMWRWWEEFWGEFVPSVVGKEKFAIITNGDIVDGVHHRATSQISHNLEDQKAIAVRTFAPLVERCGGRFYCISGTPAHGGESGCDEESVAKELGAVYDKEAKRYARYAAWIRVGNALVHCTHHIGTTGSQAYESSAIHKELTEAFVEAGRWKNEPPDFVVRSHRHRFAFTGIHTHKGRAVSLVTPSWQGKTPFAFKIPGGRQSEPQFGGVIIKQAVGGEFYFREWVKSLDRPKEVVL